jgi:hypothetical protein
LTDSYTEDIDWDSSPLNITMASHARVEHSKDGRDSPPYQTEEGEVRGVIISREIVTIASVSDNVGNVNMSGNHDFGTAYRRNGNPGQARVDHMPRCNIEWWSMAKFRFNGSR